MACLQKRRNEWAFRLKQELKIAESAYFVTLTYDDENLPLYNLRTKSFFPKKYIPAEPFTVSLKKMDVQLFLKRLRHDLIEFEVNPTKKLSGLKFKYFIVGEYGTETKRPHYHCLFFNINSLQKVDELLLKNWKHGHIHVGSVTSKSISYTAKYVINKAIQEEDRQSPFAIMSKRPAIGSNYLNTHSNYHQTNSVFYGQENGTKIGLPRYYRDKIFSKLDLEENLLKVRAIIDEKINLEEEQFKNRGENLYHSQLVQKQQFTDSSIKKLKKTSKL